MPSGTSCVCIIDTLRLALNLVGGCVNSPAQILNEHPGLWLFVQVDVIRRRLHKDILHHPVVMLNFCPDLKSISSDLRKVHGEFIFLIDRSGSMSGVNINRVKVSTARLYLAVQNGQTCPLASPLSCNLSRSQYNL